MDKKAKYQNQIDEISKQIVKEPDNAELYLKRADLYDQEEQIENAINDYSKALEINPKDSDVYYKRSICFFSQKKFDKAIEGLGSALECNPKNINVMLFYGHFFKSNKVDDIDNSINWFKKVLEIDSNNNEAKEELGKIYYQKKEYEKALEYFKDIDCELDKEIVEKIEEVSNYYLSKGEYDKALSACDGYKDLLEMSWWKLGYPLREHLQLINDSQLKQKKLEFEDFISVKKDFWIEKAKKEERDRIIRSQAHDIKNIISTIINPLMILKRTTKNPQIDRALKQAEVLSKMVNAVSLSYSGSEKDFYYDARHNSGGMSLKDMITSSVEASIGNIMQIVKYYKPFWEQYFPEYDLYEKALSEYTRLYEKTDNKSFGLLTNFLSKYMFDINIEFGDSDALIIGEKKGSDVKLLTLFNEIIFNAIKYTAFVKKEDRIVYIKFNSSNKSIFLEVENSLSGDTEVKSVGTGNLIIDNIINIMKGKVSRSKLNNRFITKIKFPNFWEDKNNGKDIVC